MYILKRRKCLISLIGLADRHLTVLPSQRPFLYFVPRLHISLSGCQLYSQMADHTDLKNWQQRPFRPYLASVELSDLSECRIKFWLQGILVKLPQMFATLVTHAAQPKYGLSDLGSFACSRSELRVTFHDGLQLHITCDAPDGIGRPAMTKRAVAMYSQSATMMLIVSSPLLAAAIAFIFLIF
ncbi:hypothetical protein O181_026332 [Austropuccinia psidii MF-1]|uniref:Uncharacterized protein n=1 Tax=Austropuccinia psidii MF-1 TaxID=1389203 RepID=A0A9Q3CQD0_9BASI|nr:hypothetical protein [Austropuccinia psidii MF-1]